MRKILCPFVYISFNIISGLRLSVCVFLMDAQTVQPIVFKLAMGKEGHLAGKIGLFYDRRFTGGYVRDREREGGHCCSSISPQKAFPVCSDQVP